MTTSQPTKQYEPGDIVKLAPPLHHFSAAFAKRAGNREGIVESRFVIEGRGGQVRYKIRFLKRGGRGKEFVEVLAGNDLVLVRKCARDLRQAATALVRHHLDGAEVHPCDSHNDDIRAMHCIPEVLALHQALKADATDQSMVDLARAIEGTMTAHPGNDYGQGYLAAVQAITAQLRDPDSALLVLQRRLSAPEHG